MDRKNQIDTFSRFTNVSRETIKTLKIYEKILIKENRTLNLIGKSTINVIWERHFLDSAQVVDYIEENDEILVDVGSGAGFPGLVLVQVAARREKPPPLHLPQPQLRVMVRKIFKIS